MYRSRTTDMEEEQPLLPSGSVGHRHGTPSIDAAMRAIGAQGRMSRKQRNGPMHGSFRSRSLERAPAANAHQGKKPAAAAAPKMANAKTGRQINKIVPLPLTGEDAQTEGDNGLAQQEVTRQIHVHCTADAFDLKKVAAALRSQFPNADVHSVSECVHCCIRDIREEEFAEGLDDGYGELFFFEYGVSIFWGLPERRCEQLLSSIVRAAQLLPLDTDEIERDNFSVCYANVQQSKIANDQITIPFNFSDDYRIKLAISHALAQSTKLCLYEARMGGLVEDTKDMPDHLAKTGKVSRTRKEIAQLIGAVFIQKSNVNLLSTVLDTPEYFWSAPDNQQALYKRVTEYLELEQRVTVLNNRFEVLTELLNIVREHENNLHIARLEWIVIWLIVVEVVVGLLECASILGIVKKDD